MSAARADGRVVHVLLQVAAAGILLQAITAGQFISGVANLLGVHSAVGSALEALGAAIVIASAVNRSARQRHRRRWLAALLLGVALLVQGNLGHAPGAVPTAIHVPLGVLVFAWATVLALPSRGRGPAPTADHVRPHTTPTAKTGAP